jgi:DNA-binding transcriptional regulator GbsR (MarR family)
MELTDSMKTFILHWGEMGSRWGVNRTVAQVHALLYLSSEPLTADEIVETLAVARSNVSTSLRELQTWNLIEVVTSMGDRRDRFRTSHDVWQLFLTVIEQRVEREIVPTLTVLRRCEADALRERPAQPEVAARIAAMAGFLDETHGWYQKIKTLPPATLRSLMRFGTGITRLLPVRGARRSA